MYNKNVLVCILRKKWFQGSWGCGVYSGIDLVFKHLLIEAIQKVGITVNK